MRASSSPASTAWPGLTRTSATVPGRGEPISFPIWVASPTSAVKRAGRVLPLTEGLAPGELPPARARRAGGAGAVRADGRPAARDGGQRGADEGQVGLRPLGQRRGREVAGDEAGVDVAGAEGGVPEGPAVEGDVGGRADDHVLAEGAQHAADRLVPGGAPGDRKSTRLNSS